MPLSTTRIHQGISQPRDELIRWRVKRRNRRPHGIVIRLEAPRRRLALELDRIARNRTHKRRVIRAIALFITADSASDSAGVCKYSSWCDSRQLQASIYGVRLSGHLSYYLAKRSRGAGNLAFVGSAEAEHKTAPGLGCRVTR
jgi:hypothetical protein